MIHKSIWLLAAVAVVVQAQDVSLEKAMDAARKHVERLESSVPNFICSERIISQLFMGDKLKQETRAEAILTTTRKATEERSKFHESRTDMRINGKPSKKNEISGPFVWQGGPAYGDLHFLFVSELGAVCLNRQLVGNVKLDGKDALLIQTHAPEMVEHDKDCHALRSDSADKIWLEPNTFNVMRIDSHAPPVEQIAGGVVTLSVDYVPVAFDGAEYWLPSHFISKLDFPGTPRHFQYEAFFRDYHKYGAESSFHVDPDQ